MISFNASKKVFCLDFLPITFIVQGQIYHCMSVMVKKYRNSNFYINRNCFWLFF